MMNRLWIIVWMASPALVAAQSEERRPPASETKSTAEVATEPEAPQPFLNLGNERLTGDWGGVRTSWEETGIELGLSMTHIYQHNVHGGLRDAAWSGAMDYVAGTTTQALTVLFSAEDLSSEE